MHHAAKKVIVVAGPTAAGKTALAIRIAELHNTEIISADSRQCYKELNVGVARPSPEELQAVPHHFIASHSIHNKVNAASFEKYALEKAQQLFSKNDVIVVVGGTGLYIDAFCNGIDPIPDVPDAIRTDINEEYNQKGIGWLQERLEKEDSIFASEGEMLNPHRMMRALEVVRATGKSITSFRKKQHVSRPFEVHKILLSPPKEQLHKNIEQRVDNMMDSGLLNEAEQLYPFRHLSALQTVGYKELFGYIENQTSLAKAVELIKVHTKQYAKRQLTWFKRDLAYNSYSNEVEILNPLKK